MRSSRTRDDDAPGADAFLDVVANLVGILIILVMVIGVGAKDEMVQSQEELDAASTSAADIDVEGFRLAAKDAEAHILDIDGKIKQVSAEMERRTRERNQLQAMTLAARAKLDEFKSQLGARRRQEFERNRQLALAQQTLAELQQRRQSLEEAAPPVGVIEHLPTPMAATVLGREEHFRLLDGRLTYIPWETLTERLKEEAPQKAWKLKEAPSITETLGPEGGFLMRYTLVTKQYITPMKVGAAVRQGIELERFVLAPVAENLGEPLEQALSPGSQFLARLSQLDPQRTTLTVWVYPNSFDHFRTLKQELFRRGFLTAARPLPEDMPIGGSPEGTRSAAQ
ncbi:MAG: coiled-coil domain-containing protein 30 [Planctomycetes bacterium]|nr:coiled-coil domain-containing protein 30 [Planctomycetota bacterium]